MSPTGAAALRREPLAPPRAAVPDLYPFSAHVHDLGLGAAADAAVWAYARTHGFTIVSKDADFHALGQLRGHPPKVIWIRRGNCSTAEVAALLRSHHPRSLAFGTDPGVRFSLSCESITAGRSLRETGSMAEP